MSLPMLLGCLWVFAATITALLPYRKQFPPGIALLVVAPILLVWIAWTHGLWIGAVGVLAFVSMFRNPLRYFARRALGKPTEVPR